MRGLVFALLLVTASGSPALASREDLARARAAYNERRLDEAIAAATAARQDPATADRGAVVLARALLERYRQALDPTDLGSAREALGAVRADQLDTPDRGEFLLALGQSLYLEDDFGAAAEIFESAIETAPAVGPKGREAVLDWFGSALERWAAPRVAAERAVLFRRLADRMDAELARHPGSRAAAYWLVVALRGEGQLERAWQAAIASWARARLAGDAAGDLRADLDRLVRQGIIPDRTRDIPDADRLTVEFAMRAEWELVKQKWR
jgi:tetratricopeptide (TPR) repeat protein